MRAVPDLEMVFEMTKMPKAEINVVAQTARTIVIYRSKSMWGKTVGTFLNTQYQSSVGKGLSIEEALMRPAVVQGTRYTFRKDALLCLRCEYARGSSSTSNRTLHLGSLSSHGVSSSKSAENAHRAPLYDAQTPKVLSRSPEQGKSRAVGVIDIYIY